MVAAKAVIPKPAVLKELGHLPQQNGTTAILTPCLSMAIKNEHGHKLGALFDGYRYKQNSEKLDIIETEVAKHEEIILKRVR